MAGSGKSKHPASGCTPAQRDAFEALCIGQQPRMGKATIDALLRRGLIQKAGEQVFGRGWSAVRVPVYEVPAHVHFAWCRWCGEQPDAAESADE